MSRSEDEYVASLEAIYNAVRDYARSELDGLVRKVIHHLQRLPATGVYGDDYGYKTLWDEYCHEIQEGPFDLPENAWDQTIEGIADDIIKQVPRHAAVLLSIFAVWELDEEETTSIAAFWPDGIIRVLVSGLAKEAGKRDLERFQK